MKTYEEVEVSLHAFLTSALHGAEWSASRAGHFAFRERTPGSNCIMRLGGPQSRSGRSGDERNPFVVSA